MSVTSDGNKTISGSYDCMVKVWNTDINSRYSDSVFNLHNLISTMYIIITCLKSYFMLIPIVDKST